VSEPEDEEVQDVTAYDDQSEISSGSSVSSGEERMADDSEAEDEALPNFDGGMEDTVDPFGNFESEIDKLRRRPVTGVKREPSVDETVHWSWTGEGRTNEGGDHVKVETNQHHEVALSNPWASQMQLLAFRASAEKIADDYLKKKDIKLSRAAHRASEVRDHHAYGEGVKDSEKIDVRRRRLE